MIIVDDLKTGINVILHPDKGTSTSMSLGGTAVLYYKFALVPLILSLIVAAALNSYHAGSDALSLIAAYVLLPIGFLIAAAVIFAIGKILKWFKGSFSGAFTATVIGYFPILLFRWLTLIVTYLTLNSVAGFTQQTSTVGSIVGLLFDLWALYITVVAYSNQQKCTKLQSLIVLIIPLIILIVLVVAVGAALVI